MHTVCILCTLYIQVSTQTPEAPQSIRLVMDPGQGVGRQLWLQHSTIGFWHPAKAPWKRHLLVASQRICHVKAQKGNLRHSMGTLGLSRSPSISTRVFIQMMWSHFTIIVFGFYRKSRQSQATASSALPCQISPEPIAHYRTISHSAQEKLAVNDSK